MAKLSTPFQLFGQAWGDYRKWWKVFAKIVLVVAVPLAVLSSLGVDPTADTTLSAYMTFAQLSMNMAIVYAIIAFITRGASDVRLRDAYYQGTAPFLRLLLVSFLLVLMMLPLVLGLVIVIVGVLAPGASLGVPEKALLGGLAVVLAIPSLLLLSRTMWSFFIIFEGPPGPIQAIKQAWRYTRGRSWGVLGRLLVLGVLLIVLFGLPLRGLALAANALDAPIITILGQVVVSLIALPLSNCYLYRLYQELRG